MSDERVEVTIKLPSDVAEKLMKVSTLAGVPIEDTFNVLLAITMVMVKHD